jgi:hypothetical protein
VLSSKKRLLVIPFLLLAIFVAALLIQDLPFTNSNKENTCYIGVAFGGDTNSQAKLLIDRIKDYSNLFILQSGPVSTNETATTEICDYAVSSGLSIIVYFGDLDPNILARKNLTWRSTWVSNAKSRYGEHFLGVYYYDERGGIYLDSDKNATNWHLPPNSTSDSVASMFENGFLQDKGTVALKAEGVPIFCSDYAL